MEVERYAQVERSCGLSHRTAHATRIDDSGMEHLVAVYRVSNHWYAPEVAAYPSSAFQVFEDALGTCYGRSGLSILPRTAKMQHNFCNGPRHLGRQGRA